MKLQLVDWLCKWNLVIWSDIVESETKRARRHESEIKCARRRESETGKANMWIKLTERKCLEQRDMAD